MMYYKLTLEQANLLGKFEISENNFFDAKAVKQSDNKYLVGEAVYDLLKEHEKFKLIDWNILETTNSLETSNIKL